MEQDEKDEKELWKGKKGWPFTVASVKRGMCNGGAVKNQAMHSKGLLIIP